MAGRQGTHGDRANHRARARAIAVVLAATGIALAAPASSAGATNGETCTNETYVWTGRARLGEGTSSVDTGVSVPSVAGTRLDVVGTSADGIDAAGFARAQPVSVGGSPATPGATVPGGSIVVSFDGAGAAVDVNGATVVVKRCTTVASAGGAATSGGSSGAAPGALPRTGRDDTVQLLIGGGLVALGSALVAAGRRRPA